MINMMVSYLTENYMTNRFKVKNGVISFTLDQSDVDEEERDNPKEVAKNMAEELYDTLEEWMRFDEI